LLAEVGVAAALSAVDALTGDHAAASTGFPVSL
jgi:hypothetical protein